MQVKNIREINRYSLPNEENAWTTENMHWDRVILEFGVFLQEQRLVTFDIRRLGRIQKFTNNLTRSRYSRSKYGLSVSNGLSKKRIISSEDNLERKSYASDNCSSKICKLGWRRPDQNSFE